jgi:hypothetical protein
MSVVNAGTRILALLLISNFAHAGAVSDLKKIATEQPSVCNSARVETRNWMGAPGGKQAMKIPNDKFKRADDLIAELSEMYRPYDAKIANVAIAALKEDPEPALGSILSLSNDCSDTFGPLVLARLKTIKNKDEKKRLAESVKKFMSKGQIPTFFTLWNKTRILSSVLESKLLSLEKDDSGALQKLNSELVSAMRTHLPPSMFPPAGANEKMRKEYFKKTAAPGQISSIQDARPYADRLYAIVSKLK